MIGHNLAKIGPNMGVAASQAPVGGRGPRTSQKFGHGTVLLGNCYFENKFHKKSGRTPHINTVAIIS